MIEIQAVLTHVKPEGALKDIKTDVYHHPMKAKHLNFSTYIYIFIINQVSVFRFQNTVADLPDVDIKSDLLECRNRPNANVIEYATGRHTIMSK